MKRELFWVKSCLGKKVYRTEDYALAVCKKMNKRFEKKNRPYYCSQCCKFHLTTKPLSQEIKQLPIQDLENQELAITEWKDLDSSTPPEDTKIQVRDHKFKIHKVIFRQGVFIKCSTQEEIKDVWLWAKLCKNKG